MTEQLVRIGKIVGCHGVRGDLKVRPSAEKADWVKNLKAVTLKHPKTGETTLMAVQHARLQGPLVLLHFQGLDDRNSAELLVGSTLYADMADLPSPQEDEFWVDDLIGLVVVDLQTGRPRGVVKDLLSSAGSDFLEIQLEESNQTVVIPFLNQFFPEVDLEKRTVSMDLLSDFLSTATEPVTADRLEQ